MFYLRITANYVSPVELVYTALVKNIIQPQEHPDSKVHEAYMGPAWGRQDPGGPHFGPVNLAIRACLLWFHGNFLTDIFDCCRYTYWYIVIRPVIWWLSCFAYNWKLNSCYKLIGCTFKLSILQNLLSANVESLDFVLIDIYEANAIHTESRLFYSLFIFWQLWHGSVGLNREWVIFTT